MKSISEYLWLSLLLLLLGAAYLSPGLGPLFSKSTTQVLSDGTDPVTLPFTYSEIGRAAETSPLNLFFGAFPNPLLDAPEGALMWVPWIEKFIVPFGLLILPVEQVSTLLVWLLCLFNGLVFYALARKLDWPRALGVALAICWAFNSFTHARTKVHMAMVGIYFLPLIFLGLVTLIKRTDRKAIYLAALCFVGASLTLHYFLILSAVLAPFLLWFYFLEESQRENWKLALGRLVLAALPAVLLLIWCLTQAGPQTMLENRASALPKTGVHQSADGVHPFVVTYAAKAIDYLGGDTALGTNDLNPLRSLVTRHIHENLDGSNTHERANGIRWFLLAITLTVLTWLCLPRFRSRLSTASRAYYLMFLCMGLFAFWLSLSPLYFGKALGPAAWLNWLVPQLRVPSRSGIFVHFAALMIAGYFLNAWLFNKASLKEAAAHPQLQNRGLNKLLSFSPTLAVLAVLSFPPLMNAMPISAVQPRYAALTPAEDACGAGLYFPYVSGGYGLLEYYYFLQRMRGTNCQILNANESNDRDKLFLQSFPLHAQVIQAITENNPQFKSGIKSFVECTGIQWLVFDRNVPATWSQDLCSSLNWQMKDAEVCIAPLPHRTLQRLPENCIAK